MEVDVLHTMRNPSLDHRQPMRVVLAASMPGFGDKSLGGKANDHGLRF